MKGLMNQLQSTCYAGVLGSIIPFCWLCAEGRDFMFVGFGIQFWLE